MALVEAGKLWPGPDRMALVKAGKLWPGPDRVLVIGVRVERW